MKKIVLFIVAHVYFLVCHAQVIGGFVFKELPYAQSKVDVLKVLDDEDFYADSDTVFLKNGKYKDYAVCIYAQRDGSLSLLKAYDMPKEKTWENLFKTYMEYRDAFQRHYGSPSDESKGFVDGTVPEYDGAKVEELKRGNCQYYSYFNLRPDWVAHLSISYDVIRGGACVSVVYMSKKVASASQGKAMEFLKIPMDGSVSEFAKKMRGKGFVLTEINDGTAILEGRFAGYDNCQIFVLESENSKNVRSVMVSFNHTKEWNSMMSVYFELRNMLVEKYGNPTKEKGRFDLDNVPANPLAELREIEKGNSEYSVVFRRPEGAIVLSVTSALNVVLGYTDMRKWEENRNKAIDDL